MGDLGGAISVWGEIGRNAAFLPLPSRLHILVEKTLQEMRNCVFTSSVGLQLQAKVTKNNQYHLQKHFLHPHRHSSAIAWTFWTFPNFALYQSNPRWEKGSSFCYGSYMGQGGIPVSNSRKGESREAKTWTTICEINSSRLLSDHSHSPTYCNIILVTISFKGSLLKV